MAFSELLCCNTVHKGRKSGLKKKCSQYLLGCVIYNATAKSHAEVFTKQSLSLTFDLTCSFQAHLVFKPRLNRIQPSTGILILLHSVKI